MISDPVSSNRASARALTDDELSSAVRNAENMARAYDHADGQQWWHEFKARESNYLWLMTLRCEQEERRRAAQAHKREIMMKPYGGQP